MVGTKSKGMFKIQREGRFSQFKSRTRLRQKFVKVPGGRTVVQYVKKKPSKAKCGSCGRILPGTANERPYKMQNMPKTKKRPERPYGGFLCTRCLRRLIIENARK